MHRTQLDRQFMVQTCRADAASSYVKTATFPEPPSYLSAFNQTFSVAETHYQPEIKILSHSED